MFFLFQIKIEMTCFQFFLSVSDDIGTMFIKRFSTQLSQLKVKFAYCKIHGKAEFL